MVYIINNTLSNNTFSRRIQEMAQNLLILFCTIGIICVDNYEDLLVFVRYGYADKNNTFPFVLWSCTSKLCGQTIF